MYGRGENGATDDKIPSCLPNNIELCTNKKLYMNLYSNTNAGHIILDDMLNLLLYQPEYICNVKEQQAFNGLLDYSPRLISRTCQENFLYFGFHQTQNLRHQVPDRVRLVRYTEPKGKSGHALMIRRRKEYGRSISDTSIPEGVVSMYVDMKKNSLLDILCEVSQYDVVIVPHGSETVFPVILKKRCIILMNDWKSDTFYFEALSQFMVTHTFLHMHSIPHVNKPHHPYYAQFSPTVDEMKALENLVNADELSPQYQRLTFRPKGTSGEGGFLQKVIDTRTRFCSSVE